MSESQDDTDLFMQEQLSAQRHQQKLELMNREHEQEMEKLSKKSARIARIEARRDIKVARAKSQDYSYSRMFKYAAAGIATIMLGVCGCQAVNEAQPKPDYTDVAKACIAKKMEWTDSYNKCKRG